MRLDEYVTYDGVGLARLLARGQITPRDLGRCVTQAVAAVNPEINAVVELYGDAIDASPQTALSGPFHGIPTLTKDFPIEAGRAAEFGSCLAQGFRAKHDAVYWTRLRNGGLVNAGRTTSSEFGVPAATETLLYGATRNPWNIAHGVSGSSGGAAAAVAAGIVPFAQGSDGGGSIRMPASFCGLIGLKPSRGRVTGSPGANAPLLGLATAFMLTRSVRDTALLLDLCHGPDAGDGYEIAPPAGPYQDAIGRPPRGLRIALCTVAWSGRTVDPEVAAATTETAARLAALGHHVEEASPSFDYAAFLAAQKIIWAADSAAGLADIAAHMGRAIDEATLGTSVLSLYRYGLTLSAAQLVDALAVYDEVTRQLGRFFAGHDLLLTPTCTIVPERIGTYDPARSGLNVDGVFDDLEPKESFTALFNATGQPAISLPAGLSRTGLPIGVQLVARFGREDLLLAVARQLEEGLEGGTGIWAQGRPAIHAGKY
ncbi:amidase family protein [Mesorhizobium opportunistum]|uniref:Amidase family protein n=1 Tax=Mesorhizobium opportunistum TaxID=593909 RepID=A0ABV1YBM7_9HYPH|nr:amidase family protein [Mesorhizobium sp.]TIN94324.1 MAG: amidase [Mesorhizobium sp.]TJU96080.1 MAG: amidase [Mesorhizobium sp.]TJV16328.1 MAG: amidase [Mesorhizobium sp.]